MIRDLDSSMKCNSAFTGRENETAVQQKDQPEVLQIEKI